MAAVAAVMALAGCAAQRGSGLLDTATADGSGGFVESPVGLAGGEKGLRIFIGLGEEVELCVHGTKYEGGV